MNKKLFAWASLAVAFLIIASFSYSLFGGNLMRNDPFRTDLLSCPAYVKNGFESAYASLKDPELTEWELELPAERCAIHM